MSACDNPLALCSRLLASLFFLVFPFSKHPLLSPCFPALVFKPLVHSRVHAALDQELYCPLGIGNLSAFPDYAYGLAIDAARGACQFLDNSPSLAFCAYHPCLYPHHFIPIVQAIIL